MPSTQNLKLFEHKKIVLIGASTGGPGQIQKIITALGLLQNTTILIAQHMGESFIPSFALHLNDSSINSINIICDGDLMKTSHIYICSGITTIFKQNSELYFKHERSPEHRFNPDINHLLNSFVPLAHELNILSVILTGIGDDGVEGCKSLSLHGAQCLTESAQSAIVDGMPSRARKEVPNIKVADLKGIITIIKEFCH